MSDIDVLADQLAHMAVGVDQPVEKRADIMSSIQPYLDSAKNTWNNNPSLRYGVYGAAGGAGLYGLKSLLSGSETPGLNLLTGGVLGAIGGVGVPLALRMFKERMNDLHGNAALERRFKPEKTDVETDGSLLDLPFIRQAVGREYRQVDPSSGDLVRDDLGISPVIRDSSMPMAVVGSGLAAGHLASKQFKLRQQAKAQAGMLRDIAATEGKTPPASVNRAAELIATNKYKVPTPLNYQKVYGEKFRPPGGVGSVLNWLNKPYAPTAAEALPDLRGIFAKLKNARTRVPMLQQLGRSAVTNTARAGASAYNSLFGRVLANNVRNVHAPGLRGINTSDVGRSRFNQILDNVRSADPIALTRGVNTYTKDLSLMQKLRHSPRVRGAGKGLLGMGAAMAAGELLDRFRTNRQYIN